MVLAELAERLSEVQAAVVNGETLIRRQRDLIVGLERDGKETSLALALLNTFIESQCFHQKDLARIIREFQEVK